MMKKYLLPALAVVFATTAVWADSVETIKAPDIAIADVTFPGGKTINLTIGYSSGAFHRPGDASDIVYAISDRGPNIKCAEAQALTGVDTKTMCDGDKSGKIFAIPAFIPSIYQFSIQGSKASLIGIYPLKGVDGKPLNGLSLPLVKTPTENPFSAAGKLLPKSTNGFDSEAIVQLKDGSFWISDEYGPSIAHVASDGRVLKRLVPVGTRGGYQGADYQVFGKLPEIIMKRTLNRGFESIAVSPDESALYFALQSPLSNPNENAYKQSRVLRLFKFDRAAEKIVGEYAYAIDKSTAFMADSDEKRNKQSSVKVSEMVAVGHDKLLVLERISKTTKLYLVDLAGAAMVPAKFDEMATSPTLEQLKFESLAANGVEPLHKKMIFDSSHFKGMPSKVEGIALIDARTLILMTDNDFAIEGKKNHIIRLRLDKPII